MLNLRNSMRADIPALQALEAAAAQRFLAIPELAMLASDGVTDTQAHIISMTQNLAWLVEDADGVILGFCYAQRLSASLYLAEISSHPTARGLGVGRMLVTHVRKMAAEYGMPGVTLTTYTDIPWNGPWYQQQGFTVLNPLSLSDELMSIVRQQEALALLPRCVMEAASLVEDNFPGNKR
ncbi:GNAT family N-acetyltransferase [uncultured Cedecea sp.]|uniref:GNAT family N-acetyltransferase n=1 Tax=uncultured Cedecea sp. TaxID=988762 RepID=UPI0026147D4E|nr:GNAT family N-acetyltransferase [uncultured Cedecea sp.]